MVSIVNERGRDVHGDQSVVALLESNKKEKAFFKDSSVYVEIERD